VTLGVLLRKDNSCTHLARRPVSFLLVLHFLPGDMSFGSSTGHMYMLGHIDASMHNLINVNRLQTNILEFNSLQVRPPTPQDAAR